MKEYRQTGNGVEARQKKIPRSGWPRGMRLTFGEVSTLVFAVQSLAQPSTQVKAKSAFSATKQVCPNGPVCFRIAEQEQ